MTRVPIAKSRPWKLVGWLTMFLVGCDLFVVSPFLPEIGKELNRSPTELTWLVSAFSIVYALMCPLQGRLAERIGIPRVLLFGVGLLGLSSLLTAVSPNMSTLLASRALAGLAAASTSPMLYALAAERSAPEHRAANLARINSGLLIALVLGAPFGLVMAGASGWRLVFAALTLAFAVMFHINRVTWRSRESPTRRNVGAATAEKMVDETLWSAWPLLSCMVLWSTSVYSIYTLLATALEKDYRLDIEGVAVILMSFGLGATIGSLRGGRLADRWGAANMVLLCLAAMAGVQAILYFIYPLQYFWALALLMFGLALSAYGFFPALQACAAQKFNRRRPTVMGLISSCLYVGITIGAAIGGHMFDAAGMRGVIVVSAAFSVTGALLALSLQRR